MYKVNWHIKYDGKILEPNTENDFKKLNAKQLGRLIKGGAITELPKPKEAKKPAAK